MEKKACFDCREMPALCLPPLQGKEWPSTPVMVRIRQCGADELRRLPPLGPGAERLQSPRTSEIRCDAGALLAGLAVGDHFCTQRRRRRKSRLRSLCMLFQLADAPEKGAARNAEPLRRFQSGKFTALPRFDHQFKAL